jgi:single-stranded-DNA-specific exonuclease
MCKKNEYSIGDELTPTGIAFYITPYINATIRMGSKSEKQTLFESMLDLKAYEEIPSTKRGCKGQMETRVEQACRNCTNIKNRQTRARDASLERIEELIKKHNFLDNKILTVLLPNTIEFEATLTGLIANQLMAKYQKPVLLLRQGEFEDETTKEKKVLWEGSARGLSQSSFDDFKQYVTNTNLFTLAQGHANAFGSAILNENIEEFIHTSNEELANYNFNPCYKIDCIFEGKHFNADEVLTIGNLSSVWGQGVEEPLVLIKNLPVTKDKLTLMKGNTLKIQLDNGCSLIRFKSSEEEYNALYSDLGCVRINVVGRCDKNVWNGRTTAQIKVVDIEIVSEEPYYF